MTPSHGWPDGTSVDSEGCLWVAFFGGWAVRRYAPDGRLLMTVRFPCANVTKLCFSGPDMATAFVTTAHKGLSQEARKTQLLAGGLFVLRPPAPGLAQNPLVLPAGVAGQHGALLAAPATASSASCART